MTAPTLFADPYKKCPQCGNWIDGADSSGPGRSRLVPCGHQVDYIDVCPSWSPVDGCTCAAYSRKNPDTPMVHEMRRPPAVDDGKVY